MSDPISSSIIEKFGAFTLWATKGFKGIFSDEMSEPYERIKNTWRNAAITLAFIIIIDNYF